MASEADLPMILGWTCPAKLSEVVAYIAATNRR